MKKILIPFILYAILSVLAAQTISNVRIAQDTDLRYYIITFDLSGNAEDNYLITLIPYRSGQELRQTRFSSGQGIDASCQPGTDLQIFWNPALEGVEADGWQFRLNPILLTRNMVFVKGGTFLIGYQNEEADAKPAHNVTVSSFYIGKYEVTQKEWVEVIGSNPSNWKGDNLPVENVSWRDAVEYCNKLSLKEGLTPCYDDRGDNIRCDWNATGFRLPTEAEWEYAARGGSKGKGFGWAGSSAIDLVAWHSYNSGEKPHAVGTKMANELGIFDMSGNLWEWCWDWYDTSYYSRNQVSDPRGADTGQYRILRGGSWFNSVKYCGIAFRYRNVPESRSNYYGLRIARSD